MIELLASHDLCRGENGLQVIMMCELLANAAPMPDFKLQLHPRNCP